MSVNEAEKKQDEFDGALREVTKNILKQRISP